MPSFAHVSPSRLLRAAIYSTLGATLLLSTATSIRAQSAGTSHREVRASKSDLGDVRDEPIHHLTTAAADFMHNHLNAAADEVRKAVFFIQVFAERTSDPIYLDLEARADELDLLANRLDSNAIEDAREVPTKFADAYATLARYHLAMAAEEAVGPLSGLSTNQFTQNGGPNRTGFELVLGCREYDALRMVGLSVEVDNYHCLRPAAWHLNLLVTSSGFNPNGARRNRLQI